MKSVQTNGGFSLQELLEFFRPHSLKLNGGNGSRDASNLLPMRANVVRRLSEPCSDAFGLQSGSARLKRSVVQIKQTAYAAVETLSAMQRGEDIIAGGVLHSRQFETRPPFLVKKYGVNSLAGRFHYEVWACVDTSPTDPSILLELCAAARALEDSIGALPEHVHIAVVNGQVLKFETSSLNAIYEELKALYLQSRLTERAINRRSVLDFAAFRLQKHQCGVF